MDYRNNIVKYYWEHAKKQLGNAKDCLKYGTEYTLLQAMQSVQFAVIDCICAVLAAQGIYDSGFDSSILSAIRQLPEGQKVFDTQLLDNIVNSPYMCPSERIDIFGVYPYDLSKEIVQRELDSAMQAYHMAERFLKKQSTVGSSVKEPFGESGDEEPERPKHRSADEVFRPMTIWHHDD